MRKLFLFVVFALCAQMLWAQNSVTQQLSPNATSTMKQLALDVTTDKCSYSPDETVTFSITGDIPSGLRVRIRHLGDVVEDKMVDTSTFTWVAPTVDFTGYLAELYTTDGTTDVIYATVAVDVSSDWTRFPRYGFVATFGGDKTKSKTTKEMAFLNRFHINGVQFQDWHNCHDWPLGGTRDNIETTYKDIANRTIYTRSIKNYIDAQHSLGMKSIFYNLCFGALDGYADRGVKEEWFIYTDKNHQNKDFHDLPDTWKSDIYVVNPGNKEWQQYLADRNDDVYYNFSFDGYQIDQLGNRGNRYDYNGNSVDLPTGYASFINAMKQRHPDKRLVMNAVSEYGESEIASTHNTDFFYNEVWGNSKNNTYTDNEATYRNLKTIIDHNRSYDASKQTVFAAYMDYLRDNNYFNTAGVVMTDAVMFALGGSHLELGGDHMLCREYFPYTGVKWHDEVEDWMKHYYDFHTAYENLLRGDWAENESVNVRSQKVTFNKWEPQLNQVTYLARDVENRTVVQFLNFTKGGDMASVSDDSYLLCWHDNMGERPWPVEYKDVSVNITGVSDVSRVWVATPDNLGGAVQDIPFTPATNRITIKLPSLQFWTMVVLEHGDTSGINNASSRQHSQHTYNLLGQSVNANYKGIIIKDGEKRVQRAF